MLYFVLDITNWIKHKHIGMTIFNRIGTTRTKVRIEKLLQIIHRSVCILRFFVFEESQTLPWNLPSFNQINNFIVTIIAFDNKRDFMKS